MKVLFYLGGGDIHVYVGVTYDCECICMYMCMSVCLTVHLYV